MPDQCAEDMYKVSSGHAALPGALWAEVLKHVPQQQRLQQCAVVCTLWAAAAAQATVHVECNLEPDAVPALQSWLAVHAEQVRYLQLASSDIHLPTLQLPLHKLTQLQHLQLQGFTLQLPGEEDGSASKPDAGSRDSSVGGGDHAAQDFLSSLQHLQLDKVWLADVSSMLQLTHAPQLNTLFMDGISFAKVAFSTGSWPGQTVRTEAGVQEVADAMPSLLQQLPQLRASHGSVSQQLNALCDLSPVCAPARLKRHKEQAAAKEQQLRLEISRLRKQRGRAHAAADQQH